MGVVAEDPTNPFSAALNPQHAQWNQPDPNNDLIRIGPFLSPAGGGIQAWIFTTTLATPADVIPPTGTIYPAIGVTMNANWTNDGLSVHMSAYAAGTQGDQPRTAYSFPPPTIDPNAPGLAFNLDRTNGNLLSQPRTSMHRIDLLTPGAVLNVGADVDPVFQPRSQGINPNFGIAGLYPDHLLRLDGLSFRFRDANSPNTNLGIVGSIGFAASPLNLSFFGGKEKDLTVRDGA